jgi:hypothetical protein
MPKVKIDLEIFEIKRRLIYMATTTLTATAHYTTFLDTQVAADSDYAWKRDDLARQGAYHDSTIKTDKGES